ncbi:MAG: isoprenylcysteine carboxylmethyltransferase family protein [Anaerolineales bacterium]|nr:isoprenylcysteine carboxylmethyltransferase family protein [Anaerolineales bacterium]
MAPNRLKSFGLVAIQFGILLALALTGPVLAMNPVFLALEIAAVVLGVWAILTVQIDKVSILPDVRADGMLVQHGPYRWLRHPMYTAVLLGALALVLNAPSLLRWMLFVVLAVDLLIKLHYEEGLLAAQYPEYDTFMAKTKRLIPFIY